MTIYGFIHLSSDEKAKATWDGEFLLTREENDSRIALYHLGSFFVEVFYNLEKNEITKFRPFKSKKLLESYLSGIDLYDLD